MKRIFFVAGESSGDMHGAMLVSALRALDPEVVCEGLGGAAMAGAGMDLRHDLAGEGIMGFVEVVRHFRPIRALFHETLAYLRETRPDALVLIDYPGFNMRLARAAAGLGIQVAYYISPQVWAWKRRRVHTLARHVNKMLVIFPFEKALYDAAGLDCTYVGHPMLDRLEARAPTHRFGRELVIGLLPGSRAQEVERLLGPMLEVARGIQARYPIAHFVTPCASEARAGQVRALAGDFPLEVQVGGMHDVLEAAHFCLVTSGTATLETALFGVPMVILYRVNALTYVLARLLVHVRHIGIVNILAGREVVPEFIQSRATAHHILPVALDLIGNTARRAQMKRDLEEVRGLLGGGGASHRAAQAILSLAKGDPHGENPVSH